MRQRHVTTPLLFGFIVAAVGITEIVELLARGYGRHFDPSTITWISRSALDRTRRSAAIELTTSPSVPETSIRSNGSTFGISSSNLIGHRRSLVRVVSAMNIALA